MSTRSAPRRENTPTNPEIPSARKRLLYFLGFALVIAAIVGLTIFAVTNDLNARFNAPRHAAKAVAQGIAVNPFLTLEGERAFPMGLVSAPDGGFYLSQFNANGISKVSAAGLITPFAKPAPAVGSVAVAADGTVFAVGYSEATQNGIGGLLKIDAEGNVTELPAIPSQNGLPLFAQLALDPAGNLYVTDPIGGQVWLYRPNAAIPELWWTAPAVSGQRSQVVAIAYHPNQAKMLVSDVGTGTVYAVEMDGSEAQTLFRQSGIDVRAITVDARTGHIFLTLWESDNGSLNLLSEDTGTLIRLADDFRAPTAAVLQESVLYVVSSDAPGLIESSGLMQPRAKPPFTVDAVDLSGFTMTAVP